MSLVLLLVSALAFLGFGANPPTADWGLMVSENRSLLSVVPWATAAPIIALSSLIVAVQPCRGRGGQDAGHDRTLAVIAG